MKLGRVLLVGDAAHAMCNRLGSGGCTGLEDAWCAAELIDLCRRASGSADEVQIFCGSSSMSHLSNLA